MLFFLRNKSHALVPSTAVPVAPITYTVTSGNLTGLKFTLHDSEIVITLPYTTTSLEIQQLLDTFPLKAWGITKS